MLKSTDCAWASGAYIRRLILRPAFCLRFRYWDSEKDCLGCQWFWLQIREKNWLDKPEKFAHKARGPIAQVPLFDISWPMAYSSSGTPATMQWHFCLSWQPHWSLPIARVRVLKLLQEGAKIVLPSCLLFGPFEPRSPQQLGDYHSPGPK